MSTGLPLIPRATSHCPAAATGGRPPKNRSTGHGWTVPLANDILQQFVHSLIEIRLDHGDVDGSSNCAFCRAGNDRFLKLQDKLHRYVQLDMIGDCASSNDGQHPNFQHSTNASTLHGSSCQRHQATYAGFGWALLEQSDRGHVVVVPTLFLLSSSAWLDACQKVACARRQRHISRLGQQNQSSAAEEGIARHVRLQVCPLRTVLPSSLTADGNFLLLMHILAFLFPLPPAIRHTIGPCCAACRSFCCQS